MATPSITTVLPPEMLLKVLNSAEADDHLALKLTCRTFNQYLTEPFSTVMKRQHRSPTSTSHFLFMPRKAEYWRSADGNQSFYGGDTDVARVRTVQAHTRVEAHFRATRRLNLLLCTICSRIRPRNSFVDGEASCHVRITDLEAHTTPVNRECIPCLCSQSSWGPSALFPLTVSGKTNLFACPGCHKALPEEQGVKLSGRYYDGEITFCNYDTGLRCCQSCTAKRGINIKPSRDGPGFVRGRETPSRKSRAQQSLGGIYFDDNDDEHELSPPVKPTMDPNYRSSRKEQRRFGVSEGA